MTQEALLQLFYGYGQVSVCTFAGVALLAIWHHVTRGRDLRQRDPGLLWLSISVLVWGLSGWVEVAQAHTIAGSAADHLRFEGWKSMLSIFNSAFILLALPRFRHLPRLIKPIVQSDSWRILVGVSFTFASILTLLMLAGWIVPVKTQFIYAIDLAFAVFTLFFLGLTVWNSFEKRGLRLLAYLAAFSIAFTLLAQVFKLTDAPFYKMLLNGTFKSILITLFFALALSWVEEMAKTTVKEASTAGFLLFNQRRDGNKWLHEIILHLPPYLKGQRLVLTEKNYALLQAFAESKKEAPQEGWLEIQPKSSNGKHYDIKDYNEINRLLANILQAIPDAGDEHKLWLKDRLFEYGKQRHIRLRLGVEEVGFIR